MKPLLGVTLFGRFSARHGDHILLDHAPHKAQELLAYLILHRQRPHPREALATLLWGDCRTGLSRKYLRQALWQLHVGLVAIGQAGISRLLHKEPGWIQLYPDDRFYIDTLEFENAFLAARGHRGESMQPSAAEHLKQAAHLYQGDLLEGWHQDWCLYERDRLRQMYLTILDKLADWCEGRSEYDAAITYASLALRCDRARERTHRALIRLLHLSGDRIGALRQYERCVAALRDELDVAPDRRTVELHQRIRANSETELSEKA
jgi:DNA-binding SARP family transcriptional activator